MDRPRNKVTRSSSSAAYKKRRSTAIGVHKVKLERVLGLTANTNSQIALDTSSGTIAYTAGCVAVLQGKRFQENIVNTSRKAVTALAFSPDGRYLAMGESGHAPAVRVYEISSRLQVAEFVGHKFGVRCVAFSPNNKYLVSIGTQHDMVTNVWNWRQASKIASNKISSKVNGLTFTSDGTTFITIGVRHVKYWFLDESKRKTTIQNKNETVPLLGRNGLLGDQKTNVFVDVSCGKGANSDSVYIISQNGTLCQLTDRQLSKTVELKTIRAYCIQATESLLIVGCANGIIRIFHAESLNYVSTLHQPHPLGVDVVTNSLSVPWPTDSYRYPDTLGLVLNESDMTLTVVYSDHSLYTWDLSRLPKIRRLSADLYHSSCVWAVDVLPAHDILPEGTFITCSSDDTIRFWNIHQTSFPAVHRKKPHFNYELLKTIYTDPSLGSLCEQEYNADKPDIYESRNGVKCIATSSDGGHLASGDLIGNVRIYDIGAMSELRMIEAHETGVLCLEYSDFDSGYKYLVSASRDRFIHIFDAANNYCHLQTLADHSSSVVSVKLIPLMEGLLMISCSNDKSVLFRVTSPDQEELHFQLKQNLISKATPHDMIVDPSRRSAITACQDRMVRLYNTQTAKQKRNYKGSNGDDGFLLKITIDNTGTFLAASCSDKTVSIIDYQSGEIVATLVGHSEVVTGLKFTNDGSQLISVSADGCIFLWRLDDRLVERMFMKTTLRRSNSELLSHSKPDVTLITPSLHSNSPLKPGKSLGNLANEIDFDETTFVVKQANQKSVLPAWAKDHGSNGRGKWDRDRATPVMTTLKNGQLQMSPDSVQKANGHANIIPIAVQSRNSLISGYDDEATDEECDDRILGDQFLSDNQFKHSLNNNLNTYKECLYYPPALERGDDFAVIHRSYNLEDERSSTSDALSLHTMESEEDGVITPRSTAASTPVSTPMSPNQYLADTLQQIKYGLSHTNGSTINTSSLDLLEPSVTEKLNKFSSRTSSQSVAGRKSSMPKTVRIKTLDSVEEGVSAPLPTDVKGGRASPLHPDGILHTEFSSIDSLTSTEEDEPKQDGASNNVTLTSDNLQEPVKLKATPENMEKDSFNEIDELCTSLRANLSTAQMLFQRVQHTDNSEKDYLVETLRDVCDGLHQMLPPTPQFEAIVHQTLHQFLQMNKNHRLLDQTYSPQADKG